MTTANALRSRFLESVIGMRLENSAKVSTINYLGTWMKRNVTKESSRWTNLSRIRAWYTKSLYIGVIRLAKFWKGKHKKFLVLIKCMNFFMCSSFLKNWHFLLRKAYKGVARSVMLPLDDMAKCDRGGVWGSPPHSRLRLSPILQCSMSRVPIWARSATVR